MLTDLKSAATVRVYFVQTNLNTNILVYYPNPPKKDKNGKTIIPLIQIKYLILYLM